MTKLTYLDQIDICFEYQRNPQITQITIAKEFGLIQRTVSKILHKYNLLHVKG